MAVWRDAFEAYVDEERWVCWELRDDRKIPVQPWSRHAEPASSTDRMTWGPLAQAEQAAQAMGLDGLGFILKADDDVIGIDLDDCRDPTSGGIDRWAMDIIEAVDSYTEVSPSGTGLKIWCRAELKRRAYKDNDQGLEVYDHARYFTVTGEHLDKTPARIERAQSAVDDIVDQYFSRDAPPQRTRSTSFDFGGGSSELDPDDWVPDALDYVQGVDEYAQWIRIGQALHDGYDGRDRGLDLWDQWSRRSGKYDQNQPGELERKWRSFGNRSGDKVTLGTIWREAERSGWAFEPPQPQPDDWSGFSDSQVGGAEAVETDEQAEEPDDTDDDGPRSSLQSLEWLSATDLYTDDSPYEPHLVEPGVIGTSDVAMVFGPPKSMKTMATMAMCTHWAAGCSWMELDPMRPLRIAYLNFEIKRDNLRRRLQLASLPDDHLEAMENNLWMTNRFVDVLSHDFIERMLASLEQGPPGGGAWDLIVVDPIIDFFPGESENDNQQVKNFIKGLKLMAHKVDPEAALLLVHHANKTSREDRKIEPFNALRGGSAFRGSYDTGISLSWESERRERLRMAFECRNSKGLEDRYLTWDEDEGSFEQDGTLHGDDERVAGEKQGRQWDKEKRRKVDVICQTLRSEAAKGRVHTQASLSRKFGNQRGLGSPRSIQRVIGEMAEKRIIGYFDAEDYGGEPHNNPSSHGHLCVPGMEVGQKDGQFGDELVSIDEAEGVVAAVTPARLKVEGYAEPKPIEQVEADRLRQPDELYPA